MNSAMAPCIIYSDSDWIVVDKPHGVATHGGDAGDLAIQEWLELHLGIKTFVCSRLDKGTSGILIFARTSDASARAERIHVEETSRKIYYFLSTKNVAPRMGHTWVSEAPLDGKPACTKFWFEKEIVANLYLYKAQISRGRMHQIRRHAAASGCPLWGDVDYGGCEAPRIALHCAQLDWPGIAVPMRSHLPLSFSEKMHKLGETAVEFAVALERRGHWIASISSSWRAVQRGELGAFDLSIDIYGQHALVWIYDEVSASKLAESLLPFKDALRDMFGVVGWVFRRISKNPHKNGLVQDVWCEDEPPSDQFSVHEHSWQAWVTLTLRQHVGLFLDHRDNRRRVELISSGKRVANLFSYTCAFGLSAARGGAEVVMNVDASGSTLNLGKKNFELNNLTESRVGKFVERDVRVWLEKQMQKIEQGDEHKWDIIVCDPPTFSLTQDAGAFHVAEAWQDLARKCSMILKNDGVCFFSTNCQGHQHSIFEKELRQYFATVQRLRAPLDFPEMHERAHARFFLCRKS